MASPSGLAPLFGFGLHKLLLSSHAGSLVETVKQLLNSARISCHNHSLSRSHADCRADLYRKRTDVNKSGKTSTSLVQIIDIVLDALN